MRWIRKSPCPGTVSTFIPAVNIQLSLLMILINFGYIKKEYYSLLKSVCTRGREARVCLQRNEAFTVSQTHTGQWLPVNESFIPICLSPLTDTLWLWLSRDVYCLPATLQMRTSVPNSPQGKRCWSEANAMLLSWTKPRFRLLVGIFKNLRSCCVFPSLDTQFTAMNRSRCTHTRTDCHTHTHIIKMPACLSSDSVTGWGNVYHRNVQYVNDTKT